jgi:hypothetical protein
MGAMIIASTIIILWSRTIFGKLGRYGYDIALADDESPSIAQFKLLAGIAAPVEFQQLVIYKASPLLGSSVSSPLD